jgi:hypothetical protein
VKEVFVSYLKHLISFAFGKSLLKVLSGQYRYLLGYIKEGAIPEGKDSLEMRSESSLCLLDKHGERLMSCFSYFLVGLIHNDSAEMIEEKCQNVLDFFGFIITLSLISSSLCSIKLI